ncbi:hypothetical protein FQZ97_1094280 [compost metagenome]
MQPSVSPACWACSAFMRRSWTSCLIGSPMVVLVAKASLSFCRLTAHRSSAANTGEASRAAVNNRAVRFMRVSPLDFFGTRGLCVRDG